MRAQDFARWMQPYARRLTNMLSRGNVCLVTGGKKMQQIQAKLLTDEVKEMEHMEPYGFTSFPHAGAELLAAFIDGDRSHGLVVCVADRRYRLTALQEGEVALHDDQGQKVHLTRTGIVIDGAAKPVTIVNATKVRMETALLEVTGEIKDRCDTDGRTMGSMRGIYNNHTHHENNSTTDQPTQQM